MIKLFTHTDLDGIGCAILAMLAYEDVEIEYCNYDDINKKVKEFLNNTKLTKNDIVFITDISLNEKIAEIVNESYSYNFVLYDHHPTALWLNKYDWCTVKVENKDGIKTCGTELFYNEWISNLTDFNSENEDIKELVQIIRDYDTWRWKELGRNGLINKKFNDLFGIYGRDRFIELIIEKLFNCNLKIDANDTAILSLEQTKINEYIKQRDSELAIAENFPINGYTCGFVFADRYISELGNTICEKHPEIDYVVIVNINAGTVSYRTVKDIDLSEIAKVFGGGGHPKASGSQFNANTIKANILQNIFCGKR